MKEAAAVAGAAAAETATAGASESRVFLAAVAAAAFRSRVSPAYKYPPRPASVGHARHISERASDRQSTRRPRRSFAEIRPHPYESRVGSSDTSNAGRPRPVGRGIFNFRGQRPLMVSQREVCVTACAAHRFCLLSLSCSARTSAAPARKLTSMVWALRRSAYLVDLRDKFLSYPWQIRCCRAPMSLPSFTTARLSARSVTGICACAALSSQHEADGLEDALACRPPPGAHANPF